MRDLAETRAFALLRFRPYVKLFPRPNQMFRELCMNPIKMLLLFGFAILLVASCGDPTATNIQNANATRAANAPIANPSANTTADGSVSAGDRIPDAKHRLEPAGGVDAVELVEDAPGIGSYTENCMICHKDTGKGGKLTIEGRSIKAADLTSAKMKVHSDEKLLVEIKEGHAEDGMPAFKDKLSDDAIMSIITHIRGLQKAAE